MLGANGCLMLCSLIPQAYTYIYTPPQTRIPHPGEGGGHGSQSHCQRPNGSESREHGRRLRVRFETVFLPQQVVPSKPRGSARSSRRLLRREREGRKIFGSSEDRAGDYVHGAMRMDRGRLRGSTDPSLFLGGGDASTVSAGSRCWSKRLGARDRAGQPMRADSGTNDES